MPNIFVYKREIICAVDFPRQGEKHATWYTYDLNGKVISYGYSKGWGDEGAGCIPVAMDNAKKSARREYTKRHAKKGKQ